MTFHLIPSNFHIFFLTVQDSVEDGTSQAQAGDQQNNQKR
jgi:hypothetical protein